MYCVLDMHLRSATMPAVIEFLEIRYNAWGAVKQVTTANQFYKGCLPACGLTMGGTFQHYHFNEGGRTSNATMEYLQLPCCI